MAHILLDGKDCYELDDDVVVFFCFPTLGIAVPMRPGDFLIQFTHSTLHFDKMQVCRQDYVYFHVREDISRQWKQ